MWLSQLSDRRIFDYSNLTITVGECDPSGNYNIEYFDVDEDDYTDRNIAPNSQATLKVLGGSRVHINSLISSGSSNQAWQLNEDLITGRATNCSFMAVNGTCSLDLSRATVSSNVVNTISNLTGSLANKTASDFTVGS